MYRALRRGSSPQPFRATHIGVALYKMTDHYIGTVLSPPLPSEPGQFSETGVRGTFANSSQRLRRVYDRSSMGSNMPGDFFSVSPGCIFARCDSGRHKLKNIYSCASCRRRERPHRVSSGARLGHRADCAGAHGLRRYHSAHAPASVRHWNTIHRHA